MSNLSYLFVGFTVIWAALFLYLFRLHHQERRLWRELEAIKGALPAGTREKGG